MAVMTTQFSEPVALDQKTNPVPSSDEMALDLDINGTSTQDTNHDPNPNNALNEPTLSPSNELATKSPEVNGSANNGAFSSNQTISTNNLEPSFESQPSATSALEELGLQDTNTTAEADISNSIDNQHFENTLVSAESAIESAVEDIAPTSTIPPVIEAPESDLRDASPPPAPEPDLQGQSLDDALDLGPNDHTLVDQTAVELDVDVNDPSADITFNSQDLKLENQNPEIPSDLQIPPLPVNGADSIPQNEPEQSQADNMDAIMDDAPAPAKLSRSREDDDEAEPSAKRTKTDDTELSQQDTPMQNGNGEHEDGPELTDYAVKEIIKLVRASARSTSGKNFRLPVAKLWPLFAAAYAEKIADEIDLETIEHRLRDGVYQTFRDVENAVQLMYENALTFNGPDHMVTKAAATTRSQLLDKLKNVSTEPAPPVVKNKKKKSGSAKRSPAPTARRASRGSHGATLPASQPTQTFALDPTSNTPLIRRDSTKLDGGRPKREIHPPKNKDLPYSVRPKSKKHANELKFCEDILSEINKPKYGEFVVPFEIPVDPVALNIPQYFQIIKKPMDLSTISKKLKEGAYTSAADFDKDMRLMLANSFKFSPLPNPMFHVTKQLEELYQSQWDKKDQYLADRSPPAASPSAGETDDEDDDEEEVVADKTQDKTLRAAKDRLVEEQSKLITLMGSKHPDQALISMQQDMVAIIQKRITEEEAQLAKTKNKKKVSKPAKKAAPLKKQSSTKKSGGRPTPKYMGTLEKETISAGLGALPDDISNEVLSDIKRERPGLDAGDDGTLELDIDVISVPLLWKIHGLIMQYAPDVQESIQRTMAAEHHPKPQARAAPKKKNKPMSKYEQERNIETLSKAIEGYGAAPSHSSGSQEPVIPSVEQQDESSGDDSDSEEE